MAFKKYKKKYEMDKKAAEAALQDILAASGQDDTAGRSHRAFHKKKCKCQKLWIPIAAAAAILAALAGVLLWQH